MRRIETKARDNYEKMAWLRTLLGGMYQDARIECDRLHKEFKPEEYVWYLSSDVYKFLEQNVRYEPTYPVELRYLTIFDIRAERVYAQKGIVLMKAVSKYEEELTWI